MLTFCFLKKKRRCVSFVLVFSLHFLLLDLHVCVNFLCFVLFFCVLCFVLLFFCVCLCVCVFISCLFFVLLKLQEWESETGREKDNTLLF